MKNIRLIALLCALALLQAACEKNDDEPYIILKNDSGQVLTSSANIQVGLNTTYRIFAEIGYPSHNGNNVDYDWKTGSGEFVQYSMYDGLDITTLGSQNNLRLEKATLDVSFSEDKVAPGSLVTIRIKDQGSVESQLTFEVN
jgi:hypothetical protein